MAPGDTLHPVVHFMFYDVAKHCLFSFLFLLLPHFISIFFLSLSLLMKNVYVLFICVSRFIFITKIVDPETNS